MSDNMTIRQRSYTMSKIRSAGNESTELRFVRILRRAKVTGWRRGVPLPGRPDFVFAGRKIAVFIDGCFWHGCPRHYSPPKSNIEYWSAKIQGNRKRDQRVRRRLRRSGWSVLTFWEHSVKQTPDTCARRIQKACGLHGFQKTV